MRRPGEQGWLRDGRDGTVVITLASHQCGPGSNPGPGVISGFFKLQITGESKWDHVKSTFSNSDCTVNSFALSGINFVNALFAVITNS